MILITGLVAGLIAFSSCEENKPETAAAETAAKAEPSLILIDTTAIPNDKFGEEVRYGRQLMLTHRLLYRAEGTKGKYLGNKMNCTNCHQDAGTKPFSFNLMASHDHYPQYRAREGKVLTLAERVNNCVMRPHNGKPLPLDSREMIAFLSYFKWINSFVPKTEAFKGEKNLSLVFPDTAASTTRGKELFAANCARCHGENGEGKMRFDNITYTYPPLWAKLLINPDRVCTGSLNRHNG